MVTHTYNPSTFENQEIEAILNYNSKFEANVRATWDLVKRKKITITDILSAYHFFWGKVFYHLYMMEKHTLCVLALSSLWNSVFS